MFDPPLTPLKQWIYYHLTPLGRYEYHLRPNHYIPPTRNRSSGGSDSGPPTVACLGQLGGHSGADTTLGRWSEAEPEQGPCYSPPLRDQG